MPALRGVRRTLVRFAGCESGATAIEYCLMAAGVALVIIVTVNGVGSALKANFYDRVETATKN